MFALTWLVSRRVARVAAPPSLSACQEALALRRGPFLDGFVLDGSPQFEEWIVVMREQVDHQAGQALTRLVDDCIQRNDFAQAAAWTRQQLALEPWNEEVHQQLIWLLAMNGQRAAALQHFDVCRRLLASELDVEPQPATEALAARIRAGASDIGPLAGHDGKPRPARRPPRPNRGLCTCRHDRRRSLAAPASLPKSPRGWRTRRVAC